MQVTCQALKKNRNVIFSRLQLHFCWLDIFLVQHLNVEHLEQISPDYWLKITYHPVVWPNFVKNHSRWIDSKYSYVFIQRCWLCVFFFLFLVLRLVYSPIFFGIYDEQYMITIVLSSFRNIRSVLLLCFAYSENLFKNTMVHHVHMHKTITYAQYNCAKICV